MSSQSNQVILNPPDWDTSAIKYMKPYVTKSGSKMISIISKQTNRTLYISTPMMITWGISDFTDANGDSDGKYSISMNFPNEEYKNEQTELFLQKMKDFENQILDDAVKMSETWWGEKMSREICKHTFFPILKYSKNKETNKVDYTKAPSFRAKVPIYDGKWNIELYNTRGELIFPNNNSDETPDKIITKLSTVACGIQSGGIWIGGKGWGVTWKLVQCVVKPKEVVSITGRCFIDLPSEENKPPSEENKENKQQYKSECYVEPVVINKPRSSNPEPDDFANANANNDLSPTTEVQDTDDEEDLIVNDAPIEKEVQQPPVKKIIKKTIVLPEPAMESETTIEAAAAAVPKKKVIKKVTKTT